MEERFAWQVGDTNCFTAPHSPASGKRPPQPGPEKPRVEHARLQPEGVKSVTSASSLCLEPELSARADRASAAPWDTLQDRAGPDALATGRSLIRAPGNRLPPAQNGPRGGIPPPAIPGESP